VVSSTVFTLVGAPSAPTAVGVEQLPSSALEEVSLSVTHSLSFSLSHSLSFSLTHSLAHTLSFSLSLSEQVQTRLCVEVVVAMPVLKCSHVSPSKDLRVPWACTLSGRKEEVLCKPSFVKNNLTQLW